MPDIVSRPNNPLYGGNRLKLGLFGTNGKGSAHTLVPEAFKPSWDNVVRTAQMADSAGYEAIVAYARWKGYIPGRVSHPAGIILDPFTYAAGVAQATSRAAIFATSHAPTIHPIAAAKQCATIDIISNGRLVLNVVAGWNRPELEMFGAPLKEHTERYEHLAEWLNVIERLWSEDEEFDFQGKFFKIVRGMSMPKPLQRPGPPIMSAGGSDTGRRFACEHADICFLLLHSEDPKDWAEQISAYKKFARDEFGRDVQVWTYAPMVQRDSMKEAQDYLRHYAVDHQDRESVDGWIAGNAATGKGMSPEMLQKLRTHFAAGGGGTQLVGTAEHIAARLHELSDAGLDGILFTWVDFIDGLTRFNRDVMPMLEALQLRAPFNPNVQFAA
ncbi:Flavin-dependent oxidoreductase, luciferase family (includes alkanesulfonate monooxygenase SsuD and methylene tetrahydromethanopterin reductase) [Rhizobiales bacterium GAS191]|nr:Flavin-dependent oxidoreductase, luciferase family (includes alkanesulfonate monooxygenase SsuD and methylene tetrahydromethanopterin reductase) [Rhizobiales bacterium GAS191]